MRVLAAKGLDLVDRAIEARFDEADSAVSALSVNERRTLERILRKLLARLERQGE